MKYFGTDGNPQSGGFANPFRWWVNNDRDTNTTDGSGDTPGVGGNYTDEIVNDLRDLVDFFPLYLNIGEVIKQFPASTGRKIKLVHSNGFNFLEAQSHSRLTKANVGNFLKNASTASAFSKAKVKRLTSDGVALSEQFLNSMLNSSNFDPILLLEGALESVSPIQVVLEIGDSSFTIMEIHVSTSNVEEMFFHKNLRGAAEGTGGKFDRDDARNYPDELTNGKHVVFLHGFNVKLDQVPGWHSEMFKRFHQSGSNARFVGVSWHGEFETGPPSPNYYDNVINAFMTADNLASYVNNLNNVTIAAHSLGNMVVSNAIVDHNMNVNQYYMIDAAVPLEAYDGRAYEGKPTMVSIGLFGVEDIDWNEYAPRLWASNWSTLFSDVRTQISWNSRFAGISKAYNFYSSEENVLENSPEGYPQMWKPNNIINFGDTVEGRYSWQTQELVKGRYLAKFQKQEVHGGWGINFGVQAFKGGYRVGVPYQLDLERPYNPTEASQIFVQDLWVKPFFDAFAEDGGEREFAFDGHALHEPNNDSQAISEASKPLTQAKLLAEAIPALSYATGSNTMTILNPLNRNFDMIQYREGTSEQWKHSRVKEFPLSWNSDLYEKFVEIGNLDEN